MESNKFIYGGLEYVEILKIIREHLCGSTFNLEFGAIAFYKFNSDNASTNVFPINPKIVEKHFPNDDNIKNKFLKEINKDRNYEQFHYCKSFRNSYNTTKHFDFELKLKHEQLEHTQSSIEGQDWNDYIKKNKKENV